MNEKLTGLPLAPEATQVHLGRALFYSLMFAAQESSFDEAVRFIYEHMDMPTPFEIPLHAESCGEQHQYICFPWKGGLD